MSAAVVKPEGITSQARTRREARSNRTGGRPVRHIANREAGIFSRMCSDVMVSGRRKPYTEKSHLLYNVIVIEMQYHAPI